MLPRTSMTFAKPSTALTKPIQMFSRAGTTFTRPIQMLARVGKTLTKAIQTLARMVQGKNKKPRFVRNGVFKRKAATYSPTNCSTICAGGLNFSVRDGKR